VAGVSVSATGECYGVHGTTNSSWGFGVYGKNASSDGAGIRGEGGMGGVVGTASGTGGYGVLGSHTASSSLGLLGTSYHGVYGRADASKGGTVGVYGLVDAGGGVGVRALAAISQTGPAGIFGFHDAASGQGSGVSGASRSPDGVAGRFVNTGGGSALWGGSDSGLLLELHRTNTSGVSMNRVVAVATNGAIYADGSYNCGQQSGCFNTGAGADLAERVDVGEQLLPGDVVEIDPDSPKRFRRARTPLSTFVAGVVSTQPAMTMNNNDLADNDSGERTDTRPLLALVGQVPVKATVENGAIRIGDLLVSSSTPGHAMRCSEAGRCAGAIIGKALEPLTTGSNVITMLVALQ